MTKPKSRLFIITVVVSLFSPSTLFSQCLPSSLDPSSSSPVPLGSSLCESSPDGTLTSSHTVKNFLDAGYPVRGTVRSKEKGEYLKDLFKDSKVPFEYVIVKDIAEPNAFDEAVKGVDAVAHTAR